MGCDIHIVAQRKTENGFEDIEGKFSEGPSPFDWRSYGMFGFLANVRNYSNIPGFGDPRGLPEDIKSDADDEWKFGDHSYSWLSIEELANFNYDATFEDLRIGKQVAPNFYDGSFQGEPGEGNLTTFREFLGSEYFKDLEMLKELKADRIVFGFDS